MRRCVAPMNLAPGRLGTFVSPTVFSSRGRDRHARSLSTTIKGAAANSGKYGGLPATLPPATWRRINAKQPSTMTAIASTPEMASEERERPVPHAERPLDWPSERDGERLKLAASCQSMCNRCALREWQRTTRSRRSPPQGFGVSFQAYNGHSASLDGCCVASLLPTSGPILFNRVVVECPT